MEKKKIGLIGAILMGIGCIVGSGIFGTLPTVANEYGPGIIWALIGAAFVVVLRSISVMYTSAALPTTASQFMWASKLWSPYVGVFISLSTLLMPTMVALFGVLFSMYFQPLFPGIAISGTAAAVILLLVFAAIAWFGNKTTVSISNIMVALLMIAIFLYVILGIPNIDANNVTFGQIVNPGIGISSLAAAIGVLTSSLSGASSVSQIANDVKRPERTIPTVMVLCPVAVAILYILMAVVTIGVVPSAEVESLSQVASHFMSPALLTFFIVGGPICGIITSLIPVALACVALIEFSARAIFRQRVEETEGICCTYDIPQERRSQIVSVKIDDALHLTNEDFKAAGVAVPGLGKKSGSGESEMRLSFHYYNNQEDIDRFFAVIQAAKRQ